MKKILIVSDGFPPEHWGGGYSIAFLHAQGLKKRGFDVRVFTTTQDINHKTGWIEYQGLPVHIFYTNFRPGWFGYHSLRNRQIESAFSKELKAFDPDIVHFHNIHNYFSYHVIAIAKQTRAKLLLTAHDVMSIAYEKIDSPRKIHWWENFLSAKKRFNPFRNWAIRRQFAKLDKIIAVSGALEGALNKNGITNTVVIHNGIATESFRQPVDEQELRKELGFGDARIVLFMGRLMASKGIEVAFEAITHVAKQIPSARLLCVGGTTSAPLQAALNKFGAHDVVVIRPSVAYLEVSKFYAIADVVIVPSIYLDPFPTVNLEAMAMGKPVVATCFGGSPEAVEDGKTGYIINPLDTDALAQKCIFLLTHPEEAKTMGEAGKKRLEEHFTLDKQLDGYCQCYDMDTKYT